MSEYNPPQEIIIPPRIAGVYLLFGKFPKQGVQCYIGESCHVWLRFYSHETRYGSGHRIILLREVKGSREARRAHEQRFQSAALSMGIRLFNSALAMPKPRAVEPECTLLRGVLTKLPLDKRYRNQMKQVTR